jgi:hypothetical protein
MRDLTIATASGRVVSSVRPAAARLPFCGRGRANWGELRSQPLSMPLTRQRAHAYDTPVCTTVRARSPGPPHDEVKAALDAPLHLLTLFVETTGAGAACLLKALQFFFELGRKLGNECFIAEENILESAQNTRLKFVGADASVCIARPFFPACRAVVSIASARRHAATTAAVLKQTGCRRRSSAVRSGLLRVSA